MPGQSETFCQTTDLYLEMLREAQRVEDKKLVRLIRNRLRHAGRPPALTSAGCEVICFPRRFCGSLAAPNEDLPFWPRFGFGQIAAFAAVYGLLISCHIFV
ncbi:MAG: hypothetical protein PVF97_08335, partial [Desulfobacterales bacterium]|jgi:hypothetical protein